MTGAAPVLDALLDAARRRLLAAVALRALALALPAAALALPLGAAGAGLAGGAALLVGVAALLPWARARWPLPERLAAHLDRSLPQLEESAELLLVGQQPAGLLAALQRRRAEAALAAHVASTPGATAQLLPRRDLARSLLAFLVAAVVGLALAVVAPLAPGSEPEATPAAAGTGTRAALAFGPIEVEIRPPAYTGLAARKVEGLEVTAEEGAELRLGVATAGGAERAVLVLDDRELALDPEGAGVFSGALVLRASRLAFLRLEAPGRPPLRSPYARLVARRDAPPAVRLLAPPRWLELAPDELGPLAVAVEAHDDYGLAEVTLVVTVAQGAGEQVSFRERRVALAANAASGPLRAGHTLDLAALDLAPGGELYLHAEAVDGRLPEPQRTRSAAHRVAVVGTARATAALGEGVLLRPPPEAFRSQRQIIVDTEALLAARPRLGPGDVLERSRRLGFDQRALRLRYGTLLGEEFVSGAALEPGGGAEAEEDHGAHPAEETLGAGAALPALPEGLVHDHDSAEAATFFANPVRARLKAALAQMWEAEKHLQTGDPRRALPFEYAALAHLKAAQEAERVYVAKSGVEPPPLDPARRLTGDLDGVGSRERRREPRPAPADPVAEALQAVRARRESGALPAGALPALEAAGRLLARRALVETPGSEPAVDLAALATLRALLAGPEPDLDSTALAALEAELWRLMPPPLAVPAPPVRGEGGLDGAYRKRLAAASGDGGGGR